MKRGWCPTVHEPMTAADGELVRIKPAQGVLSADQASLLAQMSARLGNGIVQLTSRANLQFRGLSPAGVAEFAVRAVRAGLAAADPATERRRDPAPRREDKPGLRLGIVLGVMRAPTLASLSALARSHGDGSLHLTPDRAILLPSVHGTHALPDGCIADPADPRLAVTACIGGPFCASASVDTQADATALAAARLARRVHLSGCAKLCGRPVDAEATLVGANGRYTLGRLTGLSLTQAVAALR